MAYVIDCSFSSALFLPEGKSGEVEKFFNSLKKKENIFIPLLWWHETINVLNISIKRKKLLYTDVSVVMNLFSSMNLTIDYENGMSWAKELFDLTQIYHITSYDAAYLELAHRKKAKLMSLDEDLINAAEKFGLL